MNTRTTAGIAIGLLAAFSFGWLVRGGPAPGGGAATAPEATASHESPFALEAILAIESPRERTRALLQLLDETDPAVALAMHEKMRELRKAGAVDEIAEILVASWWAEAAPETAFAHPVNPQWPDRHPWIRTVIQLWAPEDPEAAAYAVQSLSNAPADGRTAAARAVVAAWIDLDPLPDPTPLFGVLQNLEPIERGGALLHIARSLIETRGIEATLDYVRGIGTAGSNLQGDVRKEFFARTGVALLDLDTSAAAAWAAENADKPEGPGIHKHVAYYWALIEGRPAMDWAYALPDSPAKATILKRAWISFSRKHEADAKAWLTERPPSPLMRGTYRRFIRDLAKTDPEAGLALADRTEAPSLRDDMRAAAGEGWMTVDPQAATAWLAEAELPPALAPRVRSAGQTQSAPNRS